jgi:hypothetical protein
MTTEEEISKNQAELDEARQDLRDTLSQINAKLERAEDNLRLDRLIEAHPVGAAVMAGVLGYFFGSSVKSRATGTAMIAGLVGWALLHRDWSKSDGGETSADG